MSRFVVFVDGKQVPGLPSPFLIEQGGGQAFLAPGMEGYWYAKAPGYESPDGKYERVRIRHLDDYKVVMQIAPRDESLDESEWPEEYADVFYVLAFDRLDAEEKAMAEARADVQRMYGDEATAFITVTRTTQEG